MRKDRKITEALEFGIRNAECGMKRRAQKTPEGARKTEKKSPRNDTDPPSLSRLDGASPEVLAVADRKTRNSIRI
jgi:hypothetical protein